VGRTSPQRVERRSESRIWCGWLWYAGAAPV